MASHNYVIGVEEQASLICQTVDDLLKSASLNPLRSQYKVYPGDFNMSTFNKDQLTSFTITNAPSISQFKGDSTALGKLSLDEISKFPCNLQRDVVQIKSNSIPNQRLVLRFEQVDTAEL